MVILFLEVPSCLGSFNWTKATVICRAVPPFIGRKSGGGVNVITGYRASGCRELVDWIACEAAPVVPERMTGPFDSRAVDCASTASRFAPTAIGRARVPIISPSVYINLITFHYRNPNGIY